MRLFTSLAGFVLSVGLASAAVAATPDFTGVWQPLAAPKTLLTTAGAEPPLLPAAKTLYEQRKAMVAKADFSFDRTTTECAPPGEPRIYTQGEPFDIFQTPKKMVLGYQWNRLLRHIDIDAPMDVVSPYYFGTSVGHFTGDALVVDVRGFNDKFFLDRSGMPHSDQLRLTETFTLADGGKTLNLRIRFEDPKTFSKPWEAVMRFKKMEGARIAEDLCPVRAGLVPKDLQFFDPK